MFVAAGLRYFWLLPPSRYRSGSGARYRALAVAGEKTVAVSRQRAEF